ncbi:MAG: ATP-dependent DNA helicase UvrD2 [Actinomycetota bacterium]|nr:ATP-dependent DNA helicase UvrD2 [Actinomycetota bacterium]
MVFPGPAALGRGAVVGPAAAVPSPMERLERLVVDRRTLADPTQAVRSAHLAWLERRPMVVELAVDPRELRQPEVCDRPPYELDPSFCFDRERLQFLVWANNYDLRSGQPVWWWGRKAARLGATEGGPADVLLPDGAPAWCDGGPHGPLRGLDGWPSSCAVVHRESIERGRLTEMRFGEPVTELAADQLAAVSHPCGPARIVAPAGSGKTRVLTERIRHLLSDRAVEPDSLTAVAYNRRAADEMADRIGDLDCRVRTIHSLALAICNGDIGAQRARRTVVGERDVRQIVEQLVPIRHQANTDALAPYIEALSTIRIGLVAPEDAEEQVPDAAGVASAFDRYREVLKDRRMVDFDEQVYLAIEILLTDPVTRAAAQARARHLLVDEFQDLTPAYLLLLRLVAAPGFQVFGVGDDDQVIYAYAGATPEYLIDFDRYFPGSGGHALEVNYRCPPEVVDAASCLLGHNRRRIPKAIRPAPDRAACVAALAVRSVQPESAASAAAAVLGRWHDDGVEYSDMAVLSRVNASLLPVQVYLSESGVPSDKPLDQAVLRRTGTRTALAYLRIALDPRHISAADVADTARRPSRRISSRVVGMMTERSTTSLQNLRALGRRLDGSDGSKVVAYADDLETLSAVASQADTPAVLAALRTTIGLADALDDLDSSRREADRSTHVDDLAALEQVAAVHPDPATFESWLRQVLSRGGSAGGVTLSTVHRVKGREWPDVVVFGAAAGLFPHRLAGSVEEERRVFHVAITRAQREVVVLADASSPSPFVAQLSTPAGKAPPGSEVDDRRGEGPARSSRRSARSGGAAPPGTREPSAVPSTFRRPKPAGELDPAAAAVFEQLAEWRKRTAAADGVPAYVVFSDAALRGIARDMPAGVGQLGKCWGVGPAKLERYGDQVLEVLDGLRQAAERNPVADGAGAAPARS